MKKLILTFIVAAMFSAPAAALNFTDPFYMPAKGGVVSDTSLSFTNNAFRLQDSWGLTENINIGISDNLSVGVSLGWADMKHGNDGFQDPSINARYRLLEGISDGYYLDLAAYFSPEVFDSPYNHDGNAAKGSTDFGFKGLLGSTELIRNFTLGATAGFDYVGSTDETSSGSIWTLHGLAKYYINSVHSVEAGLTLRRYFGFDTNLWGYGFNINYAAELVPQTLALVPFFEVESHNKSFASSTNWGVNLRYLF